MKPKIIPLLAALICLFMLPFGFAADEKPAEPAPEPVTTADPDIPVKALGHLVVPLTKDDLGVETEGWTGLLKKHAGVISRKKIETMNAEGEAKENLLDEITRLQEQQAALIDRMKVVVEAYRVKGGDVEGYDKYIKSVSGIKMDVTDAGGSWKIATGWLKSKEGGIRWARNIALFAVTVIASLVLSWILAFATRRAVTRLKGVSELLKDFLVNIVQKIVFLLGLVIALSMLEINVGPFLAAIGAVGFILGFALQGTLSNFAAGFMILLYRPYDIGEYVEAAGVSGTVSAMNLVSTTLTLPDNQTVIIPNGSIWGGIITNVTGAEKRRIDLVFGIGYQDDIGKAQQVLETVAKNHPLVLETPEPVIRVHELADSSVNFICRPWVKSEDYWSVYWDLTRQVKEAFDSHDISIPFPQREIHYRPLTEAQQQVA